jgi:hypothetical protein
MKTLLRTLSLVAAAAAATSCGKPASSETVDASEMISVPIGVLLQSASLTGDEGFNLAVPTTSDFVIKITGCTSGFEYTATSTAGTPVNSVKLYRGDRNCVAGLESYTWQAVAYTKSGGGTLTAASALFVGAGSKEMQATVYVALSTPIDATSKASFVVAEVIKGTDHTVPVANYSEPSDLIVEGIEAPNFTIYEMQLVSIDNSGNPNFTVKLECGVARSGDNCPTALGNAQAMTSMKVALVYDDPLVYTTANTLTYSQAQAIVTAGATTITAGMVGDFNVRGGATVSGVIGQGPIDDHRNMFLVVEFTEAANNGKSYRYFNVDLANPMN